MKDEKSGVMGMEIMEFGRVVLAMLRVEIGGRMTMVMMLWATK